MKNFKLLSIATIASISLLLSCSSDKPKESTSTTTEEPKSMIDEAPSSSGLETKIEAGKANYEKTCFACHQADGKGLPAAFPPLLASDYLAADLSRAISGVVNGLSGEITVNGEKYNQVMPASTLTDEDIADVFTYILNNFDNKGGEVTAAEVKAVRK